MLIELFATGDGQDAETQRHYTYSSLKDASLDFGKGLKATYDWKKGDVLANDDWNPVVYAS